MSLNPPRTSALSRRVILRSLLASASLLGSAHLAHAGARAWVGPNTGNWFSSNWYTSNGSTYVPPDVPPAGLWNNANVDSAIFNFFNSGSLTTTVNNPVTLKSLFFNNVSDENFIIGSNALTFASGGTPGAIGNPGDIGVLFTVATINVPIAGNESLNLNPDSPYIGKLTLTRVNTFTGPLTIHRGTLELAGAGNPALNGVYNSSSVTVNDGATLLVSGYNGYAGYGGNRPPLTINSGGLVTTGDGQTCYVGDITLNGGTLASGTPDVNLGSYYLLGTIIADNNTTSTMSATDAALPVDGTPVLFDVRPGSTLNVTGTLKEIAGYSPGRIEKNGGGTLTLTAANTYTGGTTVTGGTLRLGASDAHPDAASVSIAAATLDVGAGFTDTVGTLDVTDTAATINLGSGAKLAFAASNLVSWTDSLGTLNITGAFVPGNGTVPGTNPGSLRFGTDANGLTVGQISQIIAPGWTGFGLDPYGYLTARPANEAPGFTKGVDQSVIVNAGSQSISGWATAISAGSPPEAGQALNFLVTNNNNPLFAVQPAVAADGTLTFTPAADSIGTATVAIVLQDDGGKADGGEDTSAVQTFTIRVFSLNVTTTADSGDGSLRQAIADAAARAGPDIITFSPALSGQTIALGFLENAGLEANAIAVQDTGGVTLDASALPEGITLTRLPGGAVDDHRAFYVFPGSALTLRGLTLSGFTGSVSNPFGGNSGGGGAIRNDGILALTRCILSGNTVTNSEGGAIFNSRGTLTATQCTFSSNNSAQFNGGAISNSGTLTLAQCTFSNNSGDKGGAISNGEFPEPVQLFQCTLSGNTATGGGAINNGGTLSLSHCSLSDNSCRDGGGAILNFPGTLMMENTIVSGNRRDFLGGNPDDILNLSSITANSVNLIGVRTNSKLSAGPNLLEGPPQLAPLGNYGGPTQTMPPLPGSPAIDAAVTTGFTTDQRGFPMPSDGDGNGSVIADIGAVETSYFQVVQNSNDDGPSSLRQNIADALAGSTIIFAPALSGQTITFTSGEIELDKNLTIDGSALASAVQLNGNNTTRLFTIDGGAVVTLTGLTITNCHATSDGGAIKIQDGDVTLDRCSVTGNSSDGEGGAIKIQDGNVTVDRCSFEGNSSDDEGGGIKIQYGSLTVVQSTFAGNTSGSQGGGITCGATDALVIDRCTFSGNESADEGGGIKIQSGTATVNQSTFFGNSSARGGAIQSAFATLTVNQSTISGNSAGPDAGGIWKFSGTLDVINSIVAGNTSSGGAANISGSFGGAASLTTSAPLLAPLGNYGGPTQTMALRPGSPARNAAVGSSIISDQRGFPIVGQRDIGAYEAGTFNSYETWIWETLPATATPPQRATTFDYDGDGQSNETEWTALTDPGNGTSRFAATPVRNGANLEITVPTAPGRTYTLLKSATLQGGSWTAVDIAHTANTVSTHSFQVPIGLENMFFQVRVTVP